LIWKKRKLRDPAQLLNRSGRRYRFYGMILNKSKFRPGYGELKDM
jgi:hypothetical protein